MHEPCSKQRPAWMGTLHTWHACRPTLLVPSLQLLVLSEGRMLYSGPREGAAAWLSGSLGYPYDPARHGIASDWIMDLVNIRFRKPRVRRARAAASL